MKPQLPSLRMLALPLVCLGVVGCSDADVPLDPVGQFDPGTFEVCIVQNDTCNLVGAIYAHKVTTKERDGTISYAGSYEYWKINPTAMGCSFDATNASGGHCNLVDKNIRLSPTDYTDKFNDWKNAYSATIENSIYLRATYAAHSGTNEFNCTAAACTYSPSAAAATTNFSPFAPGAYSIGGKFVTVADKGNNQFVETWFMDTFFNKENVSKANYSFTAAPCSPFECTGCESGNCPRNPTSPIQVDVTYEKCAGAPTNTDGCG